jgi:branched-chain amino acid transport system substrate-binding protein
VVVGKYKFALKSLALLAVLTIGSAACGGSPTTSTGQVTLHIGMSNILSGPIAAAVGAGWTKGATLAVDDLNAIAGTTGVKIILTQEDDQADPAVATTAMEKLIVQDKSDIVFAPGLSSAALAVMPIILREKMPTIDMGGNADSLTQQGNPYFFRVVPSFSQETGQYAEAIQKLGVKKIALVVQASDAGTSYVSSFTAAFTKVGGSIVDTESVPLSLSDFTSIISKLKSKAPDGVLSQLATSQVIPLLKAGNQQGLKVQWLGNQNVTHAVVTQLGPIAEGMYVETSFDPGVASGAAKDFVTSFTKRYGAAPDIYAAEAYAAVVVAADAAKRGGTSRAGLTKALRTTSIDSPMGHIKFDGNGQVIGGAGGFQPLVFRIQNGAWVQVN